VETEHVSRPVTLEREEVTVERRPVADGVARAAADDTMGEREIRVPIIEEELVIEKRPVVKEELVIRTRQVTEEKEIHADVRRERVDIDRSGTARRDRAAGSSDPRDETLER
jgi:uncharacterized protein (TIGR02271 family)